MDSLGVDLLINPHQMGPSPPSDARADGQKEVPVANIETFNFENFDIDSAMPSSSSGAAGSRVEASEAPSFVPKMEDFGKPATSDGFRNLNAESFLPRDPDVATSGPIRTTQEINRRKRELIRFFQRSASRNHPPSRHYTLDDSLEDMEEERKAMKAESQCEFITQLMEWGTIALANGAELASEKMPRMGIKLKGYSQNVNDRMDDFYEVFEELVEDINIDLGPGQKYLMLMVQSAVVTHSANKLTGAFGPDVTEVMKENPDLMKRFTAAVAEKTAQNAAKAKSGSGAPAPAPAAVAAPAPSVRGIDPLMDIARFMTLGGGPPAMVQNNSGNNRPPPAAAAPRPPTPPVVRPHPQVAAAPPPAPAVRREMRGPTGDMDAVMKTIQLAPPKKPRTASSLGKKSVTINV
jgi:hypothetical protein